MKKYLSTYLKEGETQANAKSLNYALETAKDNTRLIFPNGTFFLYDTIFQSGKKLYWEGAEETTFVIHHKGPGIKINQWGDIAGHINNITLINPGYQNEPTQNGVEVNGIVISENLIIRNFSGNGLHIDADVGRKSNASFSRFTSLSVSGCQGSGVYLKGGDANQCNFYHVDVRDNQGYGIHDSSFLGNQFFGCMAHNNKKGNYRADDLNSRTGFYGCYSEFGSPKEYLGGHSFWIGGLPSNGIELNGFAKAITTE